MADTKVLNLSSHRRTPVSSRLNRLDSGFRRNDGCGLTKNYAGARGFTLLEMLLVVFLMGMLAVAATAMVDNADEQQRFELTRSRLQQIRHAIVGDTSRTLNGEPVISGFVADMGRLPNNLQELVELGNQPQWQSIDLSDVTSGVNGEIWGGWRGPYLPVTPEVGGGATFRDGWGVAISPVLPNYGWQVTVPVVGALNVRSYGADGMAGGAEYDADFPDAATPHLISATNWQSGTAPVNFNVVFNKAPGADVTGLQLRVYSFEDDNVVNAAASSIQQEISTTSFGLSAVPPNPYPQTVAVSISSADYAMGRYAAVVWCSAANSVYDGDCDNGNTKLPYYFMLLPNSPLPVTITIPWNIQ